MTCVATAMSEPGEEARGTREARLEDGTTGERTSPSDDPSPGCEVVWPISEVGKRGRPGRVGVTMAGTGSRRGVVNGAAASALGVSPFAEGSGFER